MNIDPTGLEITFKKYLRTSETNYNNASSLVSGIKMPNDFSSVSPSSIYEALENLLGELSSLITETDSYIADLKAANIGTENAVDKFNSRVQTLNTDIINNTTYNSSSDQFGAQLGAWLHSYFNLNKEEKQVMNEIAGATFVNGAIAASLGVASGFERITDALSVAAMREQNANLSYYGALGALIVPDGEKAIENTIDFNKDSAMEFVAIPYTEILENKIYNIEAIQALTKNALIKSGDVAFSVIKGIASYVPLTMMPSASVPLAFLSGKGQGLEETLRQFKSSSREGLRDEYELGLISEETFKEYEKIWNYSDTEFFHNVQYAKICGKITEEQYEFYNALREMPEITDWKTDENLRKAEFVGDAYGTWEAIQMAVGQGMSKVNTIFGSKTVAIFANIGVDSGFNALDTPFRAGVNDAAGLVDFNEYINDAGGWEQIGVDALVGFGLSFLTGIGSGLDNTGKLNANEPTDLDAGLNAKEIRNELGNLGMAATIVDQVDMQNISIDVQESIRIAKERMEAFFDRAPTSGVTREKLETSFSNITVHTTHESFEAYLRQRGFEGDLKHVGGVCSDGEFVHLRPGSDAKTVVHEINHTLGSIELKDIDASIDVRGIEEAFTELISLRIMGEKGNGTTGYAWNVGKAELLVKLIEKKSGNKGTVWSYYNSSQNRFAIQDNLKSLYGSDDFYLELIQNMNNSDINGPVNTNIMFPARAKVDALLLDLYSK